MQEQLLPNCILGPAFDEHLQRMKVPQDSQTYTTVCMGLCPLLNFNRTAGSPGALVFMTLSSCRVIRGLCLYVFYTCTVCLITICVIKLRNCSLKKRINSMFVFGLVCRKLHTGSFSNVFSMFIFLFCSVFRMSFCIYLFHFRNFVCLLSSSRCASSVCQLKQRQALPH